PHVADIEKARGPAHGFVFLENAPILHRHLPPRKIHHPPAMGDVEVAKGRAFEVAHGPILTARTGPGARMFLPPEPPANREICVSTLAVRARKLIRKSPRRV